LDFSQSSSLIRTPIFAEKKSSKMGGRYTKMWGGMNPFYLYSHAMRELYKVWGIEFPDGMGQVMMLTKDQWEV